MRGSISKTVLAGLLALAVSAPITLSSPALAAFQFHGGGFGGFHGGFGGFHGGMGGFSGFHGPMGGFRPGGFAAFHPGFRPGFGFRRNVFINRNGCWGGWCGGGWWWPGFATGAIVGAAATYPYDEYGYGNGNGYGSDNGCWVYRPLYNRHGHYIGRHLVNLCY
jgi:hypothetical protein